MNDLAFCETCIGETVRLTAAVRRALSIPKSRGAFLLRPSAAPAPPPVHQVRIARTILNDCARLYDGDVFEVRSGDILLLCRLPDGGDGELHPERLASIMARLFRFGSDSHSRFVILWRLERDGSALLTYVASLGDEA